MGYSVSEAMKKLCEIYNSFPIDWDKFDSVLAGVEEINFLDEEFDETLLTEFLLDADSFHKGSNLPEAIQHFLDHGYDVKAHDGKNGGLALSELCWTSYDRYILDAAKLLLDAGAPLDYRSADDAPDEEPSGVMGTIGFKLSGAWVADKDYTWANVMEAYDAIARAAKDGLDYHGIDCFLACIGKTITGVSVIASEDEDDLISSEGTVSTFKSPLIFWFGDIPLVISRYIDFVVDPLKAEKCSKAADSHFATMIGHVLERIQYINQSICFLDFDCGLRILFSSFQGEDGDRIGAFENTSASMTELSGMDIRMICRSRGRVYSDTVTEYREDALGFITDGKAYLCYTKEGDAFSYSMEAIECSREMMHDFCWQIPISKPDAITVFRKDRQIFGMRFDCGMESLYLTASEFGGLDICLSDDRIELSDPTSFRFPKGKRMKFKRINIDN